MQSFFIYSAGVLTIIIAIMHLGIPLMRGWYKEIQQLTMISRRSIIDRNAFMILLLLIIAYLCFSVTDDMQRSDTGRALLLLFGIYWIVRAAWRWVGFPSGKLRIAVASVYLLTGVCFILALMP